MVITVLVQTVENFIDKTCFINSSFVPSVKMLICKQINVTEALKAG